MPSLPLNFPRKKKCLEKDGLKDNRLDTPSLLPPTHAVISRFGFYSSSFSLVSFIHFIMVLKMHIPFLPSIFM